MPLLESPHMSSPHDRSLLRIDTELFLLGAFILFAELLLIRWIGTEIRVFAFLGNLILVVCFFGTGLGCYLESRPVSMVRLGVNLLLLVTLIANPLHIEALNIHNTSYVLSGFEDSPLWLVGFQLTNVQVLSGLIIVAVLTYLAAFIFVPVGQLLGQGFQKHPRIIRA